jgi:hypothetical protein
MASLLRCHTGAACSGDRPPALADGRDPADSRSSPRPGLSISDLVGPASDEQPAPLSGRLISTMFAGAGPGREQAGGSPRLLSASLPSAPPRTIALLSSTSSGLRSLRRHSNRRGRARAAAAKRLRIRAPAGAGVAGRRGWAHGPPVASLPTEARPRKRLYGYLRLSLPPSSVDARLPPSGNCDHHPWKMAVCARATLSVRSSPT